MLGWGRSTGAGGGSSWTDNNSKRFGVANREGAGVSLGLGGVGESRRRFCWVCLLGVMGGMAKTEGATDKVIKVRDQETDKEAW